MGNMDFLLLEKDVFFHGKGGYASSPVTVPVGSNSVVQSVSNNRAREIMWVMDNSTETATPAQDSIAVHVKYYRRCCCVQNC